MKQNATNSPTAFNEWYPIFQAVLATGRPSNVIEIPTCLSVVARSQLRKALSVAGLGFVRMMTSSVATLVGYAQQIEKDSLVLVMKKHHKQLQVALAEIVVEDQIISCNMIFSLNLPFHEIEDLPTARGIIGEQLVQNGLAVNAVDELLIYDGEDKTLLKLACSFNPAPACWTRPPRAAKLGIDIQDAVLSGKNKKFLLLDITDSPIDIVHCKADGTEFHVGTLYSGTSIPNRAHFYLNCPSKSEPSTIKFQSNNLDSGKQTLLEMGLPAYRLDTKDVTFIISIDIDANSQHLFSIENRLLDLMVNSYL